MCSRQINRKVLYNKLAQNDVGHPKKVAGLTKVILQTMPYGYFRIRKIYSLKNLEIMSNDSGNILLALLTGAAIGAGIGILYAPDEGKETRRKIKRKVEDTSHDISERIAHAKDELTKSASEQKDKFDRKLDEAISTMSYKADDIIATLERKLEDLKKKNAQLQK